MNDIAHSPTAIERLADALTRVLFSFRQGVANKVAHLHPYTMILMALWGRVGRAQQRIARFLARVQAGTLPPVRVRSAAEKARRQEREVSRERAPAHDLGWVREVASMELNAARGHTEALLAAPEVQALMAAEPRFARLVRGVCKLLDLDAEVPGWVRRRPRAVQIKPVGKASSFGFREYLDGSVRPPPGLAFAR